MTSLAQIHKLEDRYPFNEEELEILLRCHSDLAATDHTGSFLNKLAHCSPYAFFFLPGDEIKKRVDLVESRILPAGFGERLKDAIFSDAFPEIAHSVENKALETFIEGVADCGRRGPREALRVLFDCTAGAGKNEAVARDVVALCYRLSVASDVLIEPAVDEETLASRLDNDVAAIDPLTKSLKAAAGNKDVVTKMEFVEWADSNVPIMAFTILTFVQNVIFHGKPIPPGKTPYTNPVFDQSTNVFEKDKNPLSFAVGSMTPKMGGIWHRLYSTEADGRSFNRMEWSVLGYDGPTTLLVKTEEGAILGAFAAAPWREAGEFHGNGECFLFQLDPVTSVFHSVGKDSNFMYCNASWAKGHDGLPHGLGFGGTLDKPRLFISQDFNTCTAGYLDGTYQKGNLLPEEELEQFHIASLEIWGVGGDKVISKALQERDKYRELTDSVVFNARVVTDKTGFLPDLKSGLIDTKLYKHREQTRGRAEFTCDEKHGGYSLDRKEDESVPFPNEDYFKAQ